jgi:tetratricopeptide (TPR) repeat protein
MLTMKHSIYCFAALIILLSFSRQTIAQTPAVPPAAKPDYTKEAAVAESLSMKVSFENDGTSVQEMNFRVHVQSDAGVQRYGLLTFTYQGSTQSVEIDYVRVRKSDGSVVNTPEDNIQDLDAGITREAPFYSDLREKHVAVKGLSTGDTLEYLVRWRATKSLAPGQFWYAFDFEHNSILLDEQLQVSVPRTRPIKMKSTSLSPVISEESSRRIYTWKTSNLEDHSKENEAKKDLDAKLGHLPPPEVQISSFQSWEEVGKWYSDLQGERVQPTPEIRAKAAELTKGATDPTVVIQSLYTFVSLKFRYIGVAFGIGRYQPHSADDVLSNQFGDCKDKHTLLASLLQASGITAYPALISTTHQLDPEVPSPAQFDHVISAVPQGKAYLWLDTTTKVGPFGYLNPSLRGKTALVIQGDKPGILLTTPPDLPFENSMKFTADGKLSSQGTLDSKMEYTSRGDDEVMIRAAFRSVPQTKWKDLVQAISYGIGFAGTVDNVTAASPEDMTAPFRFSYSYNRKDYSDWSNHRINMPGLPISLPEVKDDEAHANDPLWLGPPTHLVIEAKVEFPREYNPKLLEAVNLINDFAEFHATYRQENGVLISHRELLTKMRQVPDQERAEYKAFKKSVDDDSTSYITLASLFPSAYSMSMSPSPVDTSLDDSFRTLPNSENPEALRLEREANDLSGPDPNGAIEAWKKVVAEDPKFTRGWLSLGALQLTMSRTDAGFASLQKAIDSDPKEPTSYRTTAFAYVYLHRESDAIKVWQACLKALPHDQDAISNLGKLLYEQKRYVEAVPILESELDFNLSFEVMSRLADAYLRSGNIDEGFKTVLSILKLDSSPSALNNVAFDLADAKVKLPEALEYSEKAVRDEEEASQKIQLNSLTKEDLLTTLKIGAYWDTLGWVQFRSGNSDLAEKYLRASWQLSQRAPVADHLGQLYE